jgi:hypothetical protein
MMQNKNAVTDKFKKLLRTSAKYTNTLLMAVPETKRMSIGSHNLQQLKITEAPFMRGYH